MGWSYLPDTTNVIDTSLSTEDTVSTDFLGDTSDFCSKDAQGLGHEVDSLLQGENLSAHIDVNFLRQVSSSDRGRDFRN